MPPQSPPLSPLVQHLKRKSAPFYGKIAELRGEIARWLTYVPQTFGHYTSHTIDHSDEIVLQVSKVLFPPGRSKPTIDLGALETYILIASAYLHDAGMVASDHEKEHILTSDEWLAWTGEAGGKGRWNQIEDLRASAGADPLKHFAADRMTRLLIADFVRRQHHQRAGELVRSRALELGRLDVGDPKLRAAIANTCIGHGLEMRDLEDAHRFPEARDILGERVNLRLVASLLRIGDLLDLRHDRACPLLMQAACPLPADSFAHWTQYQTITHQLTEPERIEVRAECRTHEEHRALHDWCSWLVKEIASLPARLPNTPWTPPYASITKDPTITIQPSANATYLPEDWNFELDQDAVFQRLVADVYDSPEVFVRELIQNALDTTRCRMYEDLRLAGSVIPEYPTEAPEAVRLQYPVRVSLREETVVNSVSGASETVQIVTVEDQGLGMDSEIIRRYLLQVGRSYYTTTDFRRRFSFHPTSRFGLGFLSVFAVSDHVTITTHNPTSQRRDGALRLLLTGPRNYILVEKTNRPEAGTCVDVRLRKPLTSSLIELVRNWCVAVEFPVDVSELGKSERITKVDISQKERKWIPSASTEDSYELRSYPMNVRGVEGSIFALVRESRGKERWVDHFDTYNLPIDIDDLSDVTSIHGISIAAEERGMRSHLHPHLDIRRPAIIDVARTSRFALLSAADTAARLEEIVATHLGPEDSPFHVSDWFYRMRLWRDELISKMSHLRDRSDMVPAWIDGSFFTLSVNKLVTLPSLIISGVHTTSYRLADEAPISASLPEGSVLVSSTFLQEFANRDRNTWLAQYELGPLEVTTDGHLYAVCKRLALPKLSPARSRKPLALDLPQHSFDIANIGPTYHGWLMVNTSRPFGAWYIRAKAACEGEVGGLRKTMLEKLDSELWVAASIYAGGKKDSLVSYIGIWNNTPGIQQDLRCPSVSPVAHVSYQANIAS